MADKDPIVSTEDGFGGELQRDGDLPTIRDVARQAGVSIATVSRVLQGKVRVADETRTRVESAINLLGYAPHAAAQELASGKARVIGVIVDTIENPVSAAIVQGVDNALQGKGVRQLLTLSHHNDKIEQDLIRTHIVLGAKGIISVGTWCSWEFFASLPLKRVPVVLINPQSHIPEACPVPIICVDGVLGGRLAGQHLLRLGHRRVGFIGPKQIGELQRARMQGLKEATLEAGVESDGALVVNSGEGSEAGVVGVRSLLSRGRLPSALFCYHDTTAYGAMEALDEAGLRVPEDVSVVGFDDILTSRYLHLTTLAQPFNYMGKMAAEMVLDHEQRQVRRLDVRVVPELVVRRSTAQLVVTETS